MFEIDIVAIATMAFVAGLLTTLITQRVIDAMHSRDINGLGLLERWRD